MECGSPIELKIATRVQLVDGIRLGLGMALKLWPLKIFVFDKTDSEIEFYGFYFDKNKFQVRLAVSRLSTDDEADCPLPPPYPFEFNIQYIRYSCIITT